MTDNILVSSVARAGAYHVSDFLALGNETLLYNAFYILLGRAPDPESYTFFATALESKRFSPIEVLGYLRTSPEGRHRAVRIRGLRTRFFVQRLRRKLPRFGLAAWSRRSRDSRDRDRKQRAKEPALALLRESISREIATLSRPAGGPEGAPRRCLSRRASPAAAGREATFSEATRRAYQRDFCLASVCTYNYLHFAKTLIDSFRRHYPEAAVFLAVVDGEDRDLDLPPGVFRFRAAPWRTPTSTTWRQVHRHRLAAP